jgi:hypothetical protein
MSGFKIDVKSAPWWSMGQVQYEVVSPDGRCVYRTPDFGLSLRVRDVWESIQGWTSLLKEKVEMTDEQKDAIVNAAREFVEHPGIRPGFIDNFENLFTAVRAAEQQWTVGEGSHSATLNEGGTERAITRFPSSNDKLFHRIARLLNEDDAKGGNK